MATIDEDGYVHGSIGPTSNRRRRGVQTVQSNPGKGNVKQSEGTKKSANLFGDASSFAAKIRLSLKELQLIPDEHMINRLNKMMSLVVPRHQRPDSGQLEFKPKAFKILEYFEMNVNSPFRENLWVLPEIKLEEGTLHISLPEINVKDDLYFPVAGNSCKVCVEVAIGALYAGYYRRPDNDSSIMFEIPRQAKVIPAQKWTISVPAGCYCTTVMALHYYQEQRLPVSLNGEDCCPAMICDFSITPGKFLVTKNKSWRTTSSYFNKKAKVKEESKMPEESPPKDEGAKPTNDTPPPTE